MKLFFILFSICFSFIVNAQNQKNNQEKRPNIIVFFVDDMGWMDTSVPFGDSIYPLNKQFNTPNMERLAKDGVKFTSAYSTPVCTPTRASMLSGMNAAHHAITNWTSPIKNNPTDNVDDQFEGAAWKINGLSPFPNIANTTHATTYPQLLKQAGYYTIHVGKAHWASSGTPGANPLNMGFLVNISGHAAGHPQSYLGQENYGNMTNASTPQAVPDLEEYFGTDTFLTEALTIEALKAIEYPIKNNQPFYLNMAHYAVHTPLTGDKRFLKKYIDKGLNPIEAKYASLIEGMDKSLGDLMDYLKKQNIDQNTIIIFTSDNGGLSVVPLRGGKMNEQNYPLKAGKGSVYEGGIRVPMIVKWPGIVKKSSINNQYIMVEDLFPTILEMASVENYKTIQTVDGESIVPFLKNSSISQNNRALVWHYPNKWIPNDNLGTNYKSAIRKGNWKMIYNMRDGSKELYNLKEDMRESNNVSQLYPDILKQLSSELSSQLRKWNSPMPIHKQNKSVVLFPDEL